MDNKKKKRPYGRTSSVSQHTPGCALERKRSFQDAKIFLSIDQTLFGSIGPPGCGYSNRAHLLFVDT